MPTLASALGAEALARPVRLHRAARGCAALVCALALGACAATGVPAPGENASGDGGRATGASAADGTDASADAPSSLPPALDADRDRIADAADDCPDSAADEIVDASGCPLFSRVLDGIAFAPGDHLLDAESRLALDALVADMRAHPDVVVRLEGHTDNRGTAAANLELSKRRVMAVARFLVAAGVAPARLKPYGFGESRPRAGNATAAGRERNRRIEIGRESAPATPPDALAEPDAARQNGGDPGKNS